MNNDTLARFQHILNLAKHDPVYQELLQEYRSSDAPLLNLLSRLSDRDASIVMDHIGVFCALQMRFVEIACESHESPEQK